MEVPPGEVKEETKEEEKPTATETSTTAKEKVEEEVKRDETTVNISDVVVEEKPAASGVSRVSVKSLYGEFVEAIV